MKFLYSVSLFLLMWVSVAAEDYLPVDRQIEIIVNYQRMMGQVKDVPSWALEVAEDVPERIKCGTPAIMDFKDNYARLDPELLMAMGVQLNPRPDHVTDQYDSPSGRFRVHYTTEGIHAVYQPTVDNNSNGVPDYVDSVAAIADHVYTFVKDTLGYPEMPVDGFYPSGGDNRYDIYLVALSPFFYGLSYPDSVFWNDDTITAISTSFMVLRTEYNSMPGYETKPYQALQVTMAHEMYHAFQWGIDASELGAALDNDPADYVRRHWMEMSAVWMEEQTYDNVNDYYLYLPFFFDDPRSSIEQHLSTVDQHPYASVVWPLWLSQKYGRDIIRDIWLRCGELGLGAQTKKATQLAIDSISGGAENWATTFSEFALACYFVGPRYDFLPVEMHKTRHWLCADGSFPSCLDSQLVVDTATGYDKTSVDTILFTGFEEAANFPDWDWQVYVDSLQVFVDEDALHHYYDYPVYVLGNENSHAPEINGLYFMTYENLGLVPVDTTYWTCLDWNGSICSDSAEVFDTTDGYDFYHEDSSFAIYILVGDGPPGVGVVPTLSQGWGNNMVFQFEDNPDSVFVENFMLPDDQLYFRRILDTWNYRSIAFAMGAGAPDSGLYERLVYRQQEIGYYVGDSTLVDSNRIGLPPSVLKPYPNPAVVSNMEDEVVTFKFEVGTDDESDPTYNNPLLIVDIFTLAGERVATVEGAGSLARCGQYYLGTFCTEWDMRNESGADVASGVYLAYARLYSLPKKGKLLAEAHEKVAVIR